MYVRGPLCSLRDTVKTRKRYRINTHFKIVLIAYICYRPNLKLLSISVHMDKSPITHLTIDESLDLAAIDAMLRHNIRSFCFDNPEREYMHRTCLAIAPSFFNIFDLYIKRTLIQGEQTTFDELISLINAFIDNLKRHVLSDAINRAESTGLLFTWIPVVMELHRAANEMDDKVLLNATEYLEAEVHKFAISHLRLSLDRSQSKMPL
jgi:hypothetical protein